jgi:hypothetical protein
VPKHLPTASSLGEGCRDQRRLGRGCVGLGFDSRAFFPAIFKQGKPAKCWQEIASEMADEPDADRLFQFAREMDEALAAASRGESKDNTDLKSRTVY